MEFRRALGHFATGVTVVTYVPDDVDEFRGTTVNSFTSVSLQPPLVLVSLGRQTRAAAALRRRSQFAVNVLHHGQRDLAMHFAGRPDPATRVDWEVRAGVPHLAGCAAYFRCVVRDVHEAGDHRLVVGLVEEYQAHGHPPLLFYRGAFEQLPAAAVGQPDAESERERDFYSDFPELWLRAGLRPPRRGARAVRRPAGQREDTMFEHSMCLCAPRQRSSAPLRVPLASAKAARRAWSGGTDAGIVSRQQHHSRESLGQRDRPPG